MPGRKHRCTHKGRPPWAPPARLRCSKVHSRSQAYSPGRRPAKGPAPPGSPAYAGWPGTLRFGCRPGRPPHCGHFPQKGPCAPQALQHARGHKTRARATAQALQFLFCGPAGAHGAGRLPRRAGRLRLVTPRLFRIWRCPACPLAPDTPPKTPRRPRGAAGQTALPCPAFPEAHRPRRKSR